MKLHPSVTNPKAIKAFNQLIFKFRETHEELYSYDNFEYINTNTKGAITCSIHGDFEMTPKNHYHGQGCPQCSGNKKLTSRTFIEKAKDKHGDKYDYSLVKYLNNNSSIIIKCPEHGEFKQIPSNHLSGKGCIQCSGNKKLDTIEFIDLAHNAHGDKYDYSKSEYTGNKTPLTITCRIHGDFTQIPVNHIYHKYGCPSCAGNKRLTTKTFIELSRKLHGDKYDYSSVEYKSRTQDILINCPKHGLFSQKADAHLVGSGCILCGGSKVLTTESFVEKAKSIYGDIYDYSLVRYINNTTPIKIICGEHGVFIKNPNHHLRGQGCQSCSTSGFDPNKPAILYYLKILNGKPYKIGITNRSIKGRFGIDMNKIETLKTWSFKIGFHARIREKEILENFKDDLYTGLPLLVSGNSELFKRDVLGLDKKKPNTVYSQ